MVGHNLSQHFYNNIKLVIKLFVCRYVYIPKVETIYLTCQQEKKYNNRKKRKNISR